MEEINLATREIMWNIPSSFKIAMYILFVVSLVIFAKGLLKQYKFIAAGQSPKELFDSLKPLNWKNLFQTLAFQGKIPRDGNVGLFHGLIYFGFIILWIATDLVAIHYDTPFQVFQGTTYKVISFLADLGGFAIIVGIILAYQRRYIKKPDYLSATKPNQEKFMYAMLLALVIIGFLIEGIRIHGNQYPILEKSVAPIGWMIAKSYGSLGLSDETTSIFYRSLWFLHMLNTMIFVACIPYTKFSHFIFAPIAALVTKKRQGAILSPMNFEDESAETFGLGKISELTSKNRLDLLSCVECGRCSQVCPAKLADKPLDPKLIITKARDFNEAKKDENASFWAEDQIYSANEIDSCTTCGACMEECPMNIEHVNMILELKRYKTLTLGEIPPAAGDAVQKIRTQGNPWGISSEDRFKWADGLGVPVIEEGKKVDYLYYVGCAGSYDAANQKVVKDTVMLLKKAGVDFAVLGKTEKCNGDPIRRFGDEYSFFEVAIENITQLNQYQFDKVVTHCPHCLHTIGKEYGKFEDGDFETIHHTELLHDLLKTGKLNPVNKTDDTYTFHDPCYLGRHHGEYDAPREILKSIPGMKLKEMERSKDKSLCCGMGGGNMWYEIEEGEHIAHNRLKDIEKVDVTKLASACSYCMINFNSSKSTIEKTENMEIEDIASILASSCNTEQTNA